MNMAHSLITFLLQGLNVSEKVRALSLSIEPSLCYHINLFHTVSIQSHLSLKF